MTQLKLPEGFVNQDDISLAPFLGLRGVKNFEFLPHTYGVNRIVSTYLMIDRFFSVKHLSKLSKLTFKKGRSRITVTVEIQI